MTPTLRCALSGAAMSLAFAGLTATATAHTNPTTGPGPRFSIARFAVEGNSLLPAAEVERAVAPFTGTARGFADVRGAVEALQAAYRRRGFNAVVVRLPEQELDKDVVRLQVAEARIGAVKVEGNTSFDTANIRASVPGLREGAVPNVRDISASLKIANTNPAKQVTLALAESTAGQSNSVDAVDTTGAVDATLTVRDEKPWRVALTADNTGTAETGRTRLSTLVQHANLFGRDHVASLQYTTSAEKPSRVSVFGAGYHVPLYAQGDSLDFFASHSNVDSGALTAGVLDLQVSGKGSTFGARYNYTLPQWGDVASSLSFGIDHRAYRNNVDLAGFQLGGDVTVHPLSVAWAGALALPDAYANLQVAGVANLAGGAHGRDADFAAQRAGADAGYRLLRGNGLYQMQLSQDWQLRVVASGQATRDALVSGEQFGVGGSGSVRGFREREVAGDSGAFASLEVQTPNWCPASNTLALQCRGLAFADAATVSRNKALPGEEKHTSVASVGLGLRMNSGRNAIVQVDLGRVVDGGGVRASGDTRLHVSLALSY